MYKLEKFIQIFIFILFSCILISAYGGENMLSKASKPVVSIYFKNNGCDARVSINGVPIMPEAPADMGAPVKVPVNEWLHSGENLIAVSVLPLKDAAQVAEQGQKCEVEVKLVVRKDSQQKDDVMTISKINYHSPATDIFSNKQLLAGTTPEGNYSSAADFKLNDVGNIKISKTNINKMVGKNGDGIKIKQSINMPLPFPRWRWLTSDNIQNTPQIKKQLIDEYHKVWALLHDKNIQGLVPFFKERTKELSEATYLSGSNEQMFHELQNEVNNKSLTLSQDVKTVPEKYLKLVIFADDRLAKITAWDGGSVIFFNHVNGVVSDNYEIIFRKSGKNWIIAR